MSHVYFTVNFAYYHFAALHFANYQRPMSGRNMKNYHLVAAALVPKINLEFKGLILLDEAYNFYLSDLHPNNFVPIIKRDNYLLIFQMAAGRFPYESVRSNYSFVVYIYTFVTYSLAVEMFQQHLP